MAISQDLPGVSIGIFINDQLRPEHEFPDIDPTERTVDRLVEAQSNQVFEIRMTIDSSADFKGSELAFRISVDGNYVDTPVVSSDVRILGSFIEPSLGWFTSSTQVRKYKFMDIEAVAYHSTSLTSRSATMRHSLSGHRSYPTPPRVDSGTTLVPHSMPSMPDSRPKLSESRLTPSMSYTPPVSAPGAPPLYTERELSDLGTIKIEVSHVNKEQPVNFGPIAHPQSFIGNAGRQQAGRRNVTQRIGFTDPQKTDAASTWTTNNVLNVPNPAATYVFHYRAKETVKAILALSTSKRTEQKPIKTEPDIKNEPDDGTLSRIKEEDTGEAFPASEAKHQGVPQSAQHIGVPIKEQDFCDQEEPASMQSRPAEALLEHAPTVHGHAATLQSEAKTTDAARNVPPGTQQDGDFVARSETDADGTDVPEEPIRGKRRQSKDASVPNRKSARIEAMKDKME